MRKVRSNAIRGASPPWGIESELLEAELAQLDSDIRSIHEFMHREISSERYFYLNGIELNLRQPFHELCKQVYDTTLARPLPNFSTLKFSVVEFQPVPGLTHTQKRLLLQFLEESLCNIGKHAVGVTRINAACVYKDGWYCRTVSDNGYPDNSMSVVEGLGTHQARSIAAKLGVNN